MDQSLEDTEVEDTYALQRDLVDSVVQATTDGDAAKLDELLELGHFPIKALSISENVAAELDICHPGASRA